MRNTCAVFFFEQPYLEHFAEGGGEKKETVRERKKVKNGEAQRIYNKKVGGEGKCNGGFGSRWRTLGLQ